MHCVSGMQDSAQEVPITATRRKPFRAGWGLLHLGFAVIAAVFIWQATHQEGWPVALSLVLSLLAAALFLVWFSRSVSRIVVRPDALMFELPLREIEFKKDNVRKVQLQEVGLNVASLIVHTKDSRFPFRGNFQVVGSESYRSIFAQVKSVISLIPEASDDLRSPEETDGVEAALDDWLTRAKALLSRRPGMVSAVQVVLFGSLLLALFIWAPWWACKPIARLASENLAHETIPSDARCYWINHGRVVFESHGTASEEPVAFALLTGTMGLLTLIMFATIYLCPESLFGRTAGWPFRRR
jgi:hypothetical protein